jgi:hypothetical protein
MKVIRTEFDIYVVIYIYHTTIVKSNTTGSSSEAGRVHSRFWSKQHSQHRLRTHMYEGEDKGAMKPKGLNSIVNID